MGKFMRKNRRADVAVMVEGLLGVRTRAQPSSNPQLLRKALEESMEQPVKKLCSSGGDSGEEAQENHNAGVAPRETAPASAGGELNEPESGNSASSAEEIQDHADQQQQQESSSEREDDELAHLEANSRLLLHESHSDSCLRSRACPITAHSRSNSATFTQDQMNFNMSLSSGPSDHMDVSAEARQEARQEEEEEDEEVVVPEVERSPKASTKEAEPSFGDNTLVLFRAMKRSHETSAEQEEGLVASTPPASSSRSIFQSNHRRRRSAGDCGPGWRHRVASAPSPDEIEEFFTGVEGQKDDRRRFLDKYNFDVFNDVPLPGRFEWVQLQQ